MRGKNSRERKEEEKRKEAKETGREDQKRGANEQRELRDKREHGQNSGLYRNEKLGEGKPKNWRSLE